VKSAPLCLEAMKKLGSRAGKDISKVFQIRSLYPLSLEGIRRIFDGEK